MEERLPRRSFAHWLLQAAVVMIIAALYAIGWVVSGWMGETNNR